MWVSRNANVVLDVGAQLRATRDEASGLRLHRSAVQASGVLGPACDPAQGLARLLVVAVPEQVPQSLAVALRVLERPAVRRLQGVEAEEGQRDMAHPHGEMEP